jgi:hypothetical protein
VQHVRVSLLFFHVSSNAMTDFDWNKARKDSRSQGSTGNWSADVQHLVMPEHYSGVSRTAAAIPVALAGYPGARWFFKADDDSLVHVGRLVRMLWQRQYHDAFTRPFLIGSLQGWMYPRFAQGGAGYALSGAHANALLSCYW